MQTQKSILVVDEAHHLKNESGGLHRSLARLTGNYRLLLTGTPLQNNLHELWAVLHFLLPDYFTSADAFDEAVDVANHRVDAERLESARQLLGHCMLRRTKEVVRLPRKYEKLVPCPLAPLQASWYKRLLASDTATASVLTVSQLKTLIMQLRKICNHPPPVPPPPPPSRPRPRRRRPWGAAVRGASGFVRSSPLSRAKS